MDRRLKDRIEEIEAILKDVGMMQSNKLVNQIVNSGIMARQTAYDTIEEAVNAGRILKISEPREKTTAIFYSVYKNINEKNVFYLDEINKLLNQFDQKFSYFKDKLPTLSIEEIAYGFELISLFINHLDITARDLSLNFPMMKKWAMINKQINNRLIQISKLRKSLSKKDQNLIGNHIVEGRMWYLNDTIKNFDEYFDELKKSKHNPS